MVVYLIASFLGGFIIAWVIQWVIIQKVKTELKRTGGLLESERLVKETLRRENAHAFQMKDQMENELGQKLKEADELIKSMDEDILLLQKSNEETEALLKITQPELHHLKLKLIEASNTISRYKAKLGAEEKSFK